MISVLSSHYKYTSEKPEGAIKNGQSRENDNIVHTRHTTRQTNQKHTTQKTNTMSNTDPKQKSGMNSGASLACIHNGIDI
jgi:hypothetical protein